MRVDVTIDLVCVWSYLSYTRFQRVVGAFRDLGSEIEVVFRPFQLDPSATTAGEPKRDVERRYFGPDFDADAAVAELNELGSELGIGFGHDTVWSNTFDAHRLIAMASDQGVGEEMVARLFRAHHAEELNVADRDVLTKLAAEVGVTWRHGGEARLRAELEQVRRSGIRGIPVFTFDGTTRVDAQRRHWGW
jgi:predicted DsbA family dithiol-disulfide isomerase